MKTNVLTISICCIAAITAFLVSQKPSEAGQPVYVGQRVSGTQSMDAIDHSAWDQLLRRYVNSDGMVNYRKWHASAADRKALRSYLVSLSKASTSQPATSDAKLAFWINAYNAVTVEGILQKYPTTSIRNHTAKLFGYNIWHDLQLYVGGKAYSLDTMEHKILRTMNEPRIHFAIVCASIGCPRLLNEAYVSSKVQEQLETNTRDFFSRTQNFRHDQSASRFYLSAILDWFASDFGADRRNQMQTIAKWLPTEAAQRAAQSNSVSVSYQSYDWKLNAQR